MFVFFFLLWVVLNERLTVEVALIGAVISALLYLFCVRFLDYSPRREWRIIRKIPALLRYVGTLLQEIVRASIRVAYFVLSPRYEVEPQLTHFQTNLQDDASRVLLANSITLTPGTITISMENDQVCVHCLDKTMGEGLEHSDFEKQLMQLEEEAQ